MKQKVDKQQTGSLLQKCYAILWPIKRNELRRFFSMASLMFLILLNQNLIRSIKDSLVVNLIGAEVLSFIKPFVEMPAGILFVVIYTILCNKMSTENIFRIIVLFFLFFFILFGFFLFPNQELLHPSPYIVNNYVRIYPYLKWFFVMWGKWTLVLFYMMGELWPMIIFTLLYWQLANKITKTEDAGRFYFFSNLFGQANLLISGSIMIYFSRSAHFLLPWLGIHKRGVELTIAALTVVVVGLGLLMLFLHRYIEKCIMHRQMVQTETAERAKLSLGLQESFKMIVRSKYLGLICLLMISYSMVINLTEALWFHYTSLFYQQDLSCFLAFQGKVLFWMGIFTLICSFLGTTVIRKLGWLGAALVTPIMTFVIGGCFFIFVVAKHFNFLLETIYGIPTIGVIVVVGGLQNILAKGAKYCFFDATKEMAYIPLDNERQTKGKAAVDIVGGKIGKSSGSILQVICYTIFSGYTPDRLSPFLMGMFFLICIIWVAATSMLSKEYHKLLIKT